MGQVKRRENRSGKPTWWIEWKQRVRQPGGENRVVHRSAVIGPCDSISRRAAQAKADALMRDAPAPNTWTFESVARRYLETRMDRWAYRTKQNMLSFLDRWVMPRFSTTPVSDIRKMDVEAWFSTLPLSRGTATNILTEFRAIMEYALENELIKRNPARGVLLPVKMRAPARTAPYTIDEARTILAALHGSDRLMIAIMLFCGVRPGEVLALRCGDVNDPFLVIDESTDGGGRYKATKTRRTRYVAIPSGLLAQLRAHVASSTGEPDEPLFPGQHNRALWTVGGFLRHIGRALNGRIAGFNLRRLRATCATYLDADVADRRDLLGHTSETTTLNHYISGVPERQIAAVDRLEKQFVN